MSDILPTVSCALIKIFEGKEFPELKEVAFTWCLPNVPSFPDHKHTCISLFNMEYETTSLELGCTCQKHDPVFVVTSSVPAKITTDSNLSGTKKFPIQLVQSGIDFRTLQILSSHQVVQIAKILRKRGIPNPSIIYEDESTNLKLVYKIMNRDGARAVAKNAPAASAASVALPSVIQRHPLPVFIVHSKMPAKINSSSDPNLLGTTKFPIQLVKSGNDFITLQHLQSHQVTQIAKMLRESRGIQDPSIIYEDKSYNRKLVYKIINKNNARSVARNALAASE